MVVSKFSRLPYSGLIPKYAKAIMIKDLPLRVADDIQGPHILFGVFEYLANIGLAAQPIDVFLNAFIDRSARLPANSAQFRYI